MSVAAVVQNEGEGGIPIPKGISNYHIQKIETQVCT